MIPATATSLAFTVRSKMCEKSTNWYTDAFAKELLGEICGRVL